MLRHSLAGQNEVVCKPWRLKEWEETVRWDWVAWTVASIWAWRYYCSGTGMSKSYKHYSMINDNMFLSSFLVLVLHVCNNNSPKDKQCCSASSHRRRQGQTLCSKTLESSITISRESSSSSSWPSSSSSSSSSLPLICLVP